MSAQSPVIAHVLNGLCFGGTEALCLQVIKHFPPGFAHALFNLDPSQNDMRDVFVNACPNLTLIERPYARGARMRFVVGMRRDLKRIGAQGVLIYPFGVHVFVALAARAAGVERVLACAGNPPPLEPARRRVWKAIVVASRLLGVPIKSCSGIVDRKLRELAGRLPAGSEPLLNGVDVDAIEGIAGSERASRKPGDPRVVGTVARLNAIKDHDTLLRAFEQVRKRHGNCELWLIGDGERRPALTALASELGIRESVRFWGDRSDVPALLGKMDVFAFSTTRDEGFGIALAEAMAARVPIVASDVEACREVLANGDVGRLVSPNDADAFAAAISALLTEPEAARVLADRAYQRVKQELDIRRCAERYCAGLTEVPRGAVHE